MSYFKRKPSRPHFQVPAKGPRHHRSDARQEAETHFDIRPKAVLNNTTAELGDRVKFFDKNAVNIGTIVRIVGSLITVQDDQGWRHMVQLYQPSIGAVKSRLDKFLDENEVDLISLATTSNMKKCTVHGATPYFANGPVYVRQRVNRHAGKIIA